MGRIQDKRDREREAIYNQYVVYSKTASKLLLALVSVALYIGYTIYENSYAVEGIEQQVKDEVSSTYGPFNSALYESQVSHALDTLKYELPIVQKPIGNREFFIVAPIIFFLLTWFYWLYLSNSLRQFRVLHAYLGHGSSKSYSYPWLYSLPQRRISIVFVWQMILELGPIGFIAFLFITFLSGFEYYALQAVICSAVLIIPLIIHIYLFEVKFDLKGRENRSELEVFLLMGAFLIAVSLYNTSECPHFLSFDISSVTDIYVYLMAISIVERLLVGNSIIYVIPFAPILLPVYTLLWITNRTAWNSPLAVLKRLLSFTPVLGYLRYFSDRYLELKRMQ